MIEMMLDTYSHQIWITRRDKKSVSIAFKNDDGTPVEIFFDLQEAEILGHALLSCVKEKEQYAKKKPSVELKSDEGGYYGYED